MRASSPSIVSFQSSRCGPTSVTPRSISARRRASSATAQQLVDRAGVVDPERFGSPLRFVRLVDAPSVFGQRVVRRVHRRAQAAHELEPAPNHLAGRAHELLVEHVEGCDRRRVAHSGSQQRVALFQHSFEVGARRLVPHGERPEQLVEIHAARSRATLHQLEIVGCEHRNTQQAVEVARAGDRPLVALHAVATGRAQLGFEELEPVVAHDLGPDDGLIATSAHQWRVAHPSKRV